jgi:superfamily I DNA/RNA helicase
MSVSNFYERIPKEYLVKADNPNFKTHGITIPSRILVVAPSGTGKTNFVCNFIQHMCAGKGTFADILVLTKDKSEPLYEFLETKGVQVNEGLHNLPDLNKFDKEVNHLIIIDDLMMEKNQEKVCQYFMMCRKRNVTIMYLAQSFFKIPIIVRQNSNYAVILKAGNKRSLNLMLSEYVVGIDKEQFLKMYEYATKDKFNFLLINCDENDPTKRYRHNFTDYLNPDEFK